MLFYFTRKLCNKGKKCVAKISRHNGQCIIIDRPLAFFHRNTMDIDKFVILWNQLQEASLVKINYQGFQNVLCSLCLEHTWVAIITRRVPWKIFSQIYQCHWQLCKNSQHIAFCSDNVFAYFVIQFSCKIEWQKSLSICPSC